jgi:hypothetical protein
MTPPRNPLNDPPYTSPTRKSHTTRNVILIGLAVAVVLCIISMIVAVVSGDPDAPKALQTAQGAAPSTVTQGPATPTPSASAPAQATTKAAPPPPPAKVTIPEGDWTAGVDFPVGTYQTGTTTSDCFWQTWTGGDSDNKHYTDTRFGPGHFKHTFIKGETLSSQGCGTWTQM